MYKVTIAIPVYNVAPYIERALLSAFNQSFDSIEFLLIDDKGKDNSMDIVKKIIAMHPRGKDVRIIEHPENIGTGATRNSGIDFAQGEYIFFMDSDDEITPNCIETLYTKIKENPVDFVAASFDRIDCKGNISYGFNCEDLLIKGELELAQRYYSERTNKKELVYICTCNKLYNLSFLKKNRIRCIPHHLNEDLLFSFQVILKAESCRLLPEITYHYYTIPGSTTNKIEKKETTKKEVYECKEIIQFKKNYLNELKNRTIYETLLTIVMSDNFQLTSIIYNQKLKEPISKEMLKEMLAYPISFLTLKSFKNHKAINYLLYIISIMPFSIQKFMLIGRRKVMDIKKIIKK
ncbi:glycosyltransferase family 2 protein [uncultured Bacteroides sp.]|uniref:glycosyltransferase family 2 protein n=1 Tax=uncultured Bacteroides sp. TaxID=162156 RepID=UPI002AABA91B|nr:glycosyltransferase family 2 protein [uncultured Bacteroides sp.]